MTEEQFEQAMEHWGNSVEKNIEGAAKKLDHSLNRAWTHRPVRFIIRMLTFLSGVGLITSALHLFKKGSDTFAKACLISGVIIIAAEIIQYIVFSKKRR